MRKAHNVLSSGSNTGAASFNFWGPTYNRFRDASMVGYVQYTLELLPEELPADKQYYLQLTYFGDEPNGYGDFWISIDGQNLAYQSSISRLARLDFAQRYYAIPRIMTDGKQKINVRFSKGRVSLYGVKATTTDNLVEAKKSWMERLPPFIKTFCQVMQIQIYLLLIIVYMSLIVVVQGFKSLA